MDKIKWVRNGSFAVLGFSFFSILPLYAQEWDIKYLLFFTVTIIVGLVLLIVYLILENTYSKNKISNESKQKEQHMNEEIHLLATKIKQLEENNTGLKENIHEYKLENKNLLRENTNLNQLTQFLAYQIDDTGLKRVETMRQLINNKDSKEK